MEGLHSVLNMTTDKSIAVDLNVGDYVILYSDIDFESGAKGYTGGVLFEGRVSKFVPQTGKLSFTDASENIGRATFIEYTRESEGITILST